MRSLLAGPASQSKIGGGNSPKLTFPRSRVFCSARLRRSVKKSADGSRAVLLRKWPSVKKALWNFRFCRESACITFIISQSTLSGWLKVDDPPCKKRKTREQQRQQNQEYDYDSGDRESFFCIGPKNLPGLSMYRRQNVLLHCKQYDKTGSSVTGSSSFKLDPIRVHDGSLVICLVRDL